VPNYRPGLGDDTERCIRLEHGHLEYRYAPGSTCEIVNIEVEAGFRRTGIGHKLLETLLREINDKVERVYAITRADNEIAQQWYEKHQFTASPLRRFYGEFGKVDAILYVRNTRGPV
jgi:ribosomal protein S18 acetylase RimI-like enzyme